MKRGKFVRAKVRRGSTPRGQMNKTEARFADWLTSRTFSGEIRGFVFEPFKVRLGENWRTTYTPDFMIQHLDDTLELVDVKGSGGWEDDARVKIKVAAEQYPQFCWSAFTETTRGKFKREQISL